MRPAVTFSCFLVNIILQTGQFAPIETNETVWASVGGQASISCQLTEDEDVLQITWQKVLQDEQKNLAAYTKKYGYRVRPDLVEKMDFRCIDLQSCSMMIRKVVEEDEGCYQCLFNTYPRGALIGRTCLRLYELHEPVLDVSRSNSPAESVVSCSATGRPAPTVTLTVLQQNISFSHYNSSSVTHSNGTVTVTTTALLSASSSTQVGCSVSVLSAAPREKLINVPGFKETSDDGFGEASRLDDKVTAWIVGVLVFGVLLALLVIFWFRPMDHNRKPQMEKNPEEKNSNIHPCLFWSETPKQEEESAGQQRAEELFVPQHNTEEKASVLINRQSSRLSSTAGSPTTPDVESCHPLPKPKGKKST